MRIDQIKISHITNDPKVKQADYDYMYLEIRFVTILAKIEKNVERPL